MGYVQSSLTQDERIVAVGKTHWSIYAAPVSIIIPGVATIPFWPPSHIPWWTISLGVVAIGALWWLKRFIYASSTELAVTSRRVVAKFGLISRHTIELGHSKVESFHVEQSIIGRLLNYGTIVIKGSGGTSTPIPAIADPLRFRSAAIAAMEAR
ncbi:PH domain-containing protein [Tahibacter amnicola]|uniref:PH domain-containing protein n=1 Tax=Tahibacter amnicola TaxID=2976241 RepID=A0ABY6BJX8_9GAMM|nr:PH domain-containing protein [Tahibacter amnicola]UXI70324.1 PH domain-containing protein [Tahibacter amnicola]